MRGWKGQEDSADVKDWEGVNEDVRTLSGSERRSASAVLQNDMPLWASKQSASYYYNYYYYISFGVCSPVAMRY